MISRASRMKILYIGDVREGGTCLDRLRSLERLGHQVIPFSVPPYQSKIRVISSIQCRLHPRFLLQRLNDDIRSFVKQNGSFDCAWIDKGVWIFPETVTFLKSTCHLLVHYTPDPGIMFFRSRHFIESIPLYDHVVTTKDFELKLYADAGAKNVIHVPQSYCPVRYRDPAPSSRYSADIGFIGRCEPHYVNQINGLGALENVAIFGDQWIKPRNRKKLNIGYSAHASLWKEDYVTALASFKVSLGLLSKNYPEQHTTRTFEIPAAGTFLLAERTKEHLSFFEEGIEAEFFGSTDEMLSKAKFYITNEVARKRIASKGRLRCLSSGYDTDSVMKKILSNTA
jgi:spore maturation protein CgeB